MYFQLSVLKSSHCPAEALKFYFIICSSGTPDYDICILCKLTCSLSTDVNHSTICLIIT